MNQFSENKKIKLILSQTELSHEEALKELKKHNYNEIDVIREYIKTDNKYSHKNNYENKQTTNQKIYGEIRHFMDDIFTVYNEQKAKK